MRQRAVLKVGDDLFDDGVAAVVGFGVEHGQRRVGENGMVPPGREPLTLLMGMTWAGLASRTRRRINRAGTCCARGLAVNAVNGTSATSAWLTHCPSCSLKTAWG